MDAIFLKNMHLFFKSKVIEFYALARFFQETAIALLEDAAAKE